MSYAIGIAFPYCPKAIFGGGWGSPFCMVLMCDYISTSICSRLSSSKDIQVVPIRASFFGWEAAWNRLLTTDRLKRFGWSIPNRCFLCKQEEETTDHLLLFCEKARMLWLLIFSLFGVHWVMHSSVKRNLLG